jgi:8-oxo-dGTP pyrophosphatase MutT (NUDIX family)
VTPDRDALRAALARPPARVEKPGLKRAAVALVLRPGAAREAGDELLFIRRAQHPRDPWSGQIGFPGGRAEPGDAGPRETALRETREEVGLDLERDAEELGALDEVRAMARLRPQNLVIAPFVFRLVAPKPTHPSSEVDAVLWLPLARLLDPVSRGTMPYVHEGATLRFPCLDVDGLVIWGLTYRMFEDLRGRLC